VAPQNVPGTSDDLARKLMLAKNQVLEARARVKRAVTAVAQATAGAKQAKVEARSTKKEAEQAKAETEARMAEAKKAVNAAKKEAKVNDLKQDEEMKQLKVEMQADEKACGSRVTKWQQKAVAFKTQIGKLQAQISAMKAKAAVA